jgi:hypothetical protein
MFELVKILFSLIFISFFSSAAMAQGKVIMDEGGYYIQKIVIPPVDTGVVVEKGINLTTSELQDVMSGGRIVTRSASTETWGRYYLHRIHHINVTEVVELRDGVVKRVTVDERKVEERPYIIFPLIGICSLSMIISNILVRRQSSGTETAVISALFATFITINTSTVFGAVLASGAAVAAVLSASIIYFPKEKRATIGLEISNLSMKAVFAVMCPLVIAELIN